MRLQAIMILVLSCASVTQALGQTGPSAPLGHVPKPMAPADMAPPASAASVGMNDPVITLPGTCKDNAPGCVNSVTRGQFEELTAAIKPGMPFSMKRTFAIQYGKLLSFADAARALGLENDPRYQQLVQFAKNQILTESLNQHYSDEYSHLTDQQIQDYYNQNNRKYLEANLQRIIIPRQPAAAEITKPTEAEEKAFVEKVRNEWMAGGDPSKLQEEALTRMGLSSSPPDVNLANQRPGMLPLQHESVFDLKPGQISEPFTDAGAIYIYKMVSSKQLPLSEVKDQISKTLHDQKMQDKIQELSSAARPVLNEAYFGPDKPLPGPQSGTLPSGGTPTATSGSTPSPSPKK